VLLLETFEAKKPILERCGDPPAGPSGDVGDFDAGWHPDTDAQTARKTAGTSKRDDDYTCATPPSGAQAQTGA
jgi:hypothetical protein